MHRVNTMNGDLFSPVVISYANILNINVYTDNKAMQSRPKWTIKDLTRLVWKIFALMYKLKQS